MLPGLLFITSKRIFSQGEVLAICWTIMWFTMTNVWLIFECEQTVM